MPKRKDCPKAKQDPTAIGILSHIARQGILSPLDGLYGIINPEKAKELLEHTVLQR